MSEDRKNSQDKISSTSRAGESQPLKEGRDFYFNEQGLMVLTSDYLLRRGYCCKSGCTNCPYGFRKKK